MFEPLEPNDTVRLSRVVELLLVGLFALIGIAFVVGLRQGTPVPQLTGPVEMETRSDSEAIPATSYGQFDRRIHGVNAPWGSTLENLSSPSEAAPVADVPAGEVPDPAVQLLVDAELRRAFLSGRLQRRAYDGAPPVVPHPIDQMSTASCMVCHGDGRYIGKQVWSPPMSHPFYPNCTQCHAEMHSTEGAPWTTVNNDFTGRSTPGPGSRAWPGAPPTIPHTTWMRENCLSCHGPRGANPIQTSHPWRVSCTQCHAPSAALDQVFVE